MEIRSLVEQDLQAAHELVWQVFSQFEAPEYSEEGIRTFSDFIQTQSMRQRILDGELVLYGAWRLNELIGVLAAKAGGHISLFFIRAEYHRQGFGKMLFQRYLKDAAASGTEIITVNSSPYAVAVYEKLGFSKTSEEQTIQGIRFVPMKFCITNANL